MVLRRDIAHHPPAMGRTSTDAIEVGRRLRQLRSALGFAENQKGFAEEMIGVSAQRWNNYEQGTRVPDLAAAAMIVSATGITRDWIYDGDVRGLSPDILQRLASAKQPNRRG